MQRHRLLWPIAVLGTAAALLAGSAAVIGAAGQAGAATTYQLGFEGSSSVPYDSWGSSLSISNRVARSGSQSLAQRTTSLSGGWDLDAGPQPAAEVTPGVKYTATVWAQTSASGIQVNVSLNLLGSDGSYVDGVSPPNVTLPSGRWVQLSVTFTPMAGVALASFSPQFENATSPSTIYWDDLAVADAASPPTTASTTTTTQRATTTTTMTPRTTTTAVRAATTTTSSTSSTSTTSTVPASTTTTALRTGGLRWVPPAGNVPWQWEIGHPLNTSSASDMGTGATLPSGAPAPNPVVYDIDGFDNPASTVATLHSMGFHVICYVEVGAAETYRPDYGKFPAAALGNTMAGYPSEKYIDIRNQQVVSTIEARIQMCADKGFDAIEPDIDESYNSSTGFPLTKAIEESFMRTLTTYAHNAGVAMLMKNPDDTGDSYAADMVPYTDGALSEQCNEYTSCDALLGYITAGKPVFQVEYNVATSSFCPADNSRNFNGMKQNVSLTGGRQPCR